MIKFKEEEGFLKIEHLVGNVGRLVFVKETIPLDELEQYKPHNITPDELDEFVKTYPHFDIRVGLSLKKLVGGVATVTQCYAHYKICSLIGTGRASAFNLGGGDTPAFVPRTPYLEFHGDDTGIYVDITPIHSFALRTFYGD